MNEVDLNSEENKILITLLDYLKYNYEEEKSRTINLEKKARLIALFLGGGALALFSKLPIEKIQQLIHHDKPLGYFIIAVLLVSFVLLIIATIYNILVYKIRTFERLCDPNKFALKANSFSLESELLSSIAADYVVASNRNYEQNEVKAKYLSYSIYYLLSGLVLYSISLYIMNINFIVNGA